MAQSSAIRPVSTPPTTRLLFHVSRAIMVMQKLLAHGPEVRCPAGLCHYCGASLEEGRHAEDCPYPEAESWLKVAHIYLTDIRSPGAIPPGR
jgi:hypothetical protein